MLCITRMRGCWLAVAVLLAGAVCRAEEQREPGRWKLIGGYLRSGQPGPAAVREEAPIPVPETPRLERHFRSEWEAWFHRAVVDRCFPEAPSAELRELIGRLVREVLVDFDRTS